MKRTFFLPPAVVLMAVLLAPCGQEDEDAGTADTTASSTTSTMTAGGPAGLTQTCVADRYEVDYPDGWSTNAGDVVPRCRFFHPEPFTVPRDTEVVGLAVILHVETMPYSEIVEGTGSPSEEVLDRREMAVSGRPALRVEVRSTNALLPKGTPSLRYMIDLGDATLVAATHGVEGTDHDRNRMILDAMVATLAITEPKDCSAAALSGEPEEQDLPGPVAEMRRSIIDAATACDFERLAELAQEGAFTYSFGGGDDPASHWQTLEAEGDQPLAVLVRLLGLPSVARTEGDPIRYLWPRAYAYESWDEVPAEAREELGSIYSPDDLEDFERFGAYIGYRVGISAEGDWQFFVAGD